MNNIKKLCLYAYDCIKSTGKASGFNNLRSKDNKIIFTSNNIFAPDDKNIIELMVKQALNKSTMSIYKGFYILENENICSPLLYAEASLSRDNKENIILQYDTDNIQFNFNMISQFLDNDDEKIENIVTQLMNIEAPLNIDILKVITGLIPNMNKLKNKGEAVFLSNNAESIAGVLNELKKISEMY